MAKIDRSAIAASMKSVTKTEFHIPAKFSSTNINSLINNKPIETVVAILRDIENETKKHCKALNGDVASIKLHKLGRYEGYMKFSGEGYVMSFTRPETRAEFDRRVDVAVEMLKEKARHLKQDAARKAKKVAKLKKELANLEK